MNWENWSEGLPFLSSIEKLILFNDKLIAATTNGLWVRDTSGTITETQTTKNGLPEKFILYQNYPNPFNPSTKIKFTIPTPPSSSPLAKGRTEVGFVNLIVYDVLGNVVATLVNEEKPPGEYEVEFSSKGLTRLPDGQVNQTHTISSGIYFYQLKAGSFVKTNKMLLLK